MNSLRILLISCIAALGMSLSGSISAAMNFYVAMKVDGESIEAEPTVDTMGGDDVENKIEGYSFDHQVRRDEAGRVTHGEIRIVKRIDKSTPLLHKALDEASEVEAELKFYRPDADTGQTRPFHKLTLVRGRITGVVPWLTTGVGGGTLGDPFLEAITVTYGTLVIESLPNGPEHEYTVEVPR